MRVTVFGATGKIGRLAVARLVADSHHVVAVARNPTGLSDAEQNLTVLRGPLSDQTTVAEAVADSDAVISTLGPSLKRSDTRAELADGVRGIVAAMRDARVRRFVGLATPSIPDPRDAPHWKHRVLPLTANLLFPNALAELIAMTSAVTESDLDYTIARITRPTDKPAKRTVRAGFLGHDKVGSAMTRTDIADFLVDQLTDTRYLRTAPAISN